MSEQLHVSHLSLRIEGAPAPADAAADLIEVVIDHSLHLPSMFSIRLYSHEMRWLEAENFRDAIPALKKLGVKEVGLAPQGKAEWRVSGTAKKKLISERAQIEGGIGTIKTTSTASIGRQRARSR